MLLCLLVPRAGFLLLNFAKLLVIGDCITFQDLLESLTGDSARILLNIPAIIIIFGKLGRLASEETILHLVKAKCVPILLYGSEACSTKKSE